jgi:hypothetical protein
MKVSLSSSTVTLAAMFGLSLLLAGGCQDNTQAPSSVGEFGQNLVDYFTGNTPANAARRMEDRYFADERRIGINRLSDRPFGRKPPYTTRYEQIARYDSDALVRATAIRALNRSRDQSAIPLFIDALSDPNVRVRLEGAKALANMPSADAVAPLQKIVANSAEDSDVRIASADALRHYKRLDVARVLIAVLQDREFGVAWQANQSLQAITGRNLKYDESRWLTFITGPDQPFG